MLRGWIQSKSANASTHSLDTLAEPQHCTDASYNHLANDADLYL